MFLQYYVLILLVYKELDSVTLGQNCLLIFLKWYVTLLFAVTTILLKYLLFSLNCKYKSSF